MNTFFPILIQFSNHIQKVTVLLAVFLAVPSNALFSQDLLQVDCRWTGKLTQEGVIPFGTVPPDIDAVFVITERKGEDFKARLEEEAGKLKVTYNVEGKIKRSKDGKVSLNFKITEVVSSFPPGTKTFPLVSFDGRISMAMISGTWKYPENDQGIELNGKFDFKFKSRKKTEKPKTEAKDKSP